MHCRANVTALYNCASFRSDTNHKLDGLQYNSRVISQHSRGWSHLQRQTTMVRFSCYALLVIGGTTFAEETSSVALSPAKNNVGRIVMVNVHG